MLFPRSSGILLHPISLPGRYGIGDLGNSAYKFIDFLHQAGQSVWQILPLNPTSYGDSPYQALSVFAGNTNLISLDKLVESGWLTADDLADCPDFPIHRVDYGWVIDFHQQKLRVAHERFQLTESKGKQAFDTWCQTHSWWLEDFSLFVALKAENGGKPWTEWDIEERDRLTPALQSAKERLAEQIQLEKFKQWLFFLQWGELKTYAASKGVRIIGNMPIFVGYDSADVWGNRAIFYLDDDGHPTVVAGVPPDYFSATGQRWGNPLYQWKVLKKQNYRWWRERLSHALSLVDIVLIDHFRGFDSYWEIPASEFTAAYGSWQPGPGAHFFEAMQQQFGDELPLIAEDIGSITEGAVKLRNDFNLPGMKVLQFAFSNPENPFLPHNYTQNCVVYTGTHDSDTAIGWYNKVIIDDECAFFHKYLGKESCAEPNWDMIRVATQSVAHTVIIPLQDILGLGAVARMNTPGLESGNWGWRFQYEQLTDEFVQHLRELTHFYNRLPEDQKYAE